MEGEHSLEVQVALVIGNVLSCSGVFWWGEGEGMYLNMTAKKGTVFKS